MSETDMTAPVYADLYHMPEDMRITVIGHTAESGQVVAFVVERQAKADRYIRKLLARHKVRIVGRDNGPAGTIVIRVAPAES